MFSLCVKASFVKAYDFTSEVFRSEDMPNAFFLLPSLRSICEDLIVLGFLRSIPNPERNELLTILMFHEVRTKIRSQSHFFEFTRPFQPVLSPTENSSISDLESKSRSFWKANGWPNMQRGVNPQIRQIAEKQGQFLLAALYDYLYRLTSGMVHFNPQILLRLGWHETSQNVRFSAEHFKEYYSDMCRIYGCYLFCLYFEIFRKNLRPSHDNMEAIENIRFQLSFESRWPEMVTFEEMNIRPPKQSGLNLFHRFLFAGQSKQGFLNVEAIERVRQRATSV